MLTMRVEGGDLVLEAFRRLQDKSVRKDLMEDIAAYGESSTQQRFLDQAGPDGQKWKPSARAQAEGGQTLRDTNRLFQSITSEADDRSAAWGTNVVYAGIHQFGGVIRPKNAEALMFKTVNGFVTAQKVTMPARPFLGLSAADRVEIGHIVNDWLREALP